MVETCDAHGCMALICLSQERFVLELNCLRWSSCGLGSAIPKKVVPRWNSLRDERPLVGVGFVGENVMHQVSTSQNVSAIGTNEKTDHGSGVGTLWTSRNLYAGLSFDRPARGYVCLILLSVRVRGYLRQCWFWFWTTAMAARNCPLLS